MDLQLKQRNKNTSNHKLILLSKYVETDFRYAVFNTQKQMYLLTCMDFILRLMLSVAACHKMRRPIRSSPNGMYQTRNLGKIDMLF